MAASMWRMNGLWRRIAGVLVLCILLLSNEVICQDDSTDAVVTVGPDSPADADAVTDAAVADATAATTLGAAPSVANGGDSAAATPAADDGQVPEAAVPVDDSQDGDTSGISGTTAAPVMVADVTQIPEEIHTTKLVVPQVNCVGKENVPENNAVKAVVATTNCEDTKRIIQENPGPWCGANTCNLDIYQDGNTLLVSSSDAKLNKLAGALQGEHLKDKLGVTKAEAPSSSGSSVFVGILVTGLLAAIAITVGYFKCQRKTDTKGVRLAEEAYPVDQENQGNTLVSVAPLNPPPETPEKPSVNGESPEAAKTQPPPPTNGHSTAKTADTEL